MNTDVSGLEHGSSVAVYAGSDNSRISSKYLNLCRKMNESLTGLERHEGD